MTIVFMGSSTFAIPSLRTLEQAQFDVKAVYSQPPRKAGRGKRYKEVPLAEFAFSQGLKVEQPQTFNDPDVLAILKSYNPDFLVVVAYGLILPRKVLEIPKEFSINVHGSFLPHWRGAAPIQRSIMNLDKETGISIMKISEELDSGPVSNIYKINLENNSNAIDIAEKLSYMASEKILENVDDILDDKAKFVEQDHTKATYAKKIEKNVVLLHHQKGFI